MLTRRTHAQVWSLMGSILFGGCTADSPTRPPGDPDLALTCSIPAAEIFRGQVRDGIPAISNPPMDVPGSSGTIFWSDSDRVVGMILGDQPIAVPLNVFWWHEILNLDMDGHSIAITHCPLTGSSLAFDREPLGGVEFGVSGLLFRNNLIMYDRSGENASLWPQMSLGARCGPEAGRDLPLLPSVEMTYGGWRRLHPNTLVVSAETGWDRDYSRSNYPYGRYDAPDNRQLLFPLPGGIDTRYPPKERVLGVPTGTGGRAFPYSALAALGPIATVSVGSESAAYVVFWDGNRQGAAAYRPILEGQPLTFHVEDGVIRDEETGSAWDLTGVATSGPLFGNRLEGVERAFVAFWFSWPAFYPNIEAWSSR